MLNYRVQKYIKKMKQPNFHPTFFPYPPKKILGEADVLRIIS